MDHFFIFAPLSNFEWYWWFQVIIFSIGCPILFVLFIIHLVNSISDLCTSNRRSIRSSPIKPDMNYKYVSTISLSMISIALFFWSPSAALLWIFNYQNCNLKLYVLIATDAWLIAKLSMYLLFLFRLHITYKGSAYEYNPKYLLIIGIVNCLWTLACCVNAILFTEIKIKYYEHVSFGAHYDLYYPFWCVIIVSANDIIMSIVFVYLFVNPLKKITNKMCYKNGENIECIMETYCIGIKALILTSMSIFTTWIHLTCLLITNTIILLPIDSIINCICIMMITPYYSDDKYYKKLCILPIKCSKKWKMKNILPIKPIIKIETVTSNNTPYNTPITHSGEINIEINIDNNNEIGDFNDKYIKPTLENSESYKIAEKQLNKLVDEISVE